MWRLINCVMAFNFIRRAMMMSGVGILVTLSIIFDVAYVCSIIIGMPFVAFKLDKGLTHDDVQGGYTALMSLGGAFTIPFVLIVASLDSFRSMPGGAMICSLILSFLQAMVLTIIKPAAKDPVFENDAWSKWKPKDQRIAQEDQKPSEKLTRKKLMEQFGPRGSTTSQDG